MTTRNVPVSGESVIVLGVTNLARELNALDRNRVEKWRGLKDDDPQFLALARFVELAATGNGTHETSDGIFSFSTTVPERCFVCGRGRVLAHHGIRWISRVICNNDVCPSETLHVDASALMNERDVYRLRQRIIEVFSFSSTIKRGNDAMDRILRMMEGGNE